MNSSALSLTLPNGLRAALEDLEQALAAMGNGDPVPYAALLADHGDVTLFGAWGPIERGFGPVTRTFDWVASRFSDGALVPQHEVIGYSGDLAYTVGFERGKVRVDGTESGEMTLRVTHVLRRVDGTWRIVHRPECDNWVSWAASTEPVLSRLLWPPTR